MTIQKFVQNENIRDLTKNTGIPGRTLYDIRYGTYKNIKLSTVRQLLEEMLKKGYTEIELFNMIMKEENHE